MSELNKTSSIKDKFADFAINVEQSAEIIGGNDLNALTANPLHQNAGIEFEVPLNTDGLADLG